MRMGDFDYINFYFKELDYDDEVYCGLFLAPDWNIRCRFWYDRQNETTEIWDSNRPVESILPLPIWWLDYKLEEGGVLEDSVCRICY